MKKKFYLLMTSIILLSMQLKAQSPNQLNYQGVARNSGGTVIPNQSIGLRFTIHQGSSSGTSVYQETQTTTTNQFGLFTVAIGSGTVVSGTFSTIGWGANSEFLQVEMDPTGGTSYTDMGTTQFLSVPYSLYAATNSQWATSGKNIYNKNNGSVGIGTTTPDKYSQLNVTSTRFYGGEFSTDSLNNYSAALYGNYTGTGNYNAWGVGGYSYPADGYGIGGNFTGGWEGVFANAYGSTNGYEYIGLNAASTSNSGYAYGISSYATDAGSGTAYGIYANGNTLASGVAYGVYGVGAPVGTYGYAQGAGIEYLEIGSSFGSSQIVAGVVGENTASSGYNTAYYNDGVLGITTNPDATVNSGVFGYATGGSTWNVGVLGVGQTTTNDFYSIGVYGQENPDGGVSLSLNDAGYFYGDVDIIGSISKSSGTFKIDDPLDPANKFLYHSFVESPDMMNVYNGNITTDAGGNAIVTLPAYFQAENKDFKYQLTVIGQFAQAIVATEISNNQFTIKTDKPNVKVSWQVTGVRNDPYANEHRVVAEVEKKGIEKGHYLFPQYYGQPKSMSIGNLAALIHNAKSSTRVEPTPAQSVPKKSNGTTKTTN